MIVGFTGSRNGMTDCQKESVYLILKTHKHGISEFHHGDCVGADCQAHVIAVDCGYDIIIHPPTNTSLRAFCEGTLLKQKNYLERNRNIVDCCDVLLACPNTIEEQKRSGTWYTIRYAMRSGKQFRIIYPYHTHIGEL